MREPQARMTVVLLAALLAGAPAALGGAVFISGDDADDDMHCQGTRCGALYPTALRLLYEQCDPVPLDRDGILAIGVNGDPALASLLSWNDIDNGGPGAPIRFLTSVADIATVAFAQYRVLYLPSSDNNVVGGISTAQIAALSARVADIQTYVNLDNGRLLSLTEGDAVGAYGWLPAPLSYLSFDDTQDNVDPTPEMDQQFPGTQANPTNMDHCCYHTLWTGPAGYSGLHVLAVSKVTQITDPANPPALIDGPVILGGCAVKLTPTVCDATNHNDPDCWTCGNAWLDPGELCDDGNLVSGDGCESDCTPTVGFCTAPLGVLYPLLGVRRGIEAEWSWPAIPDTRGYRVYSVLRKELLDATVPGQGARGSNATAVNECETFDAAALTCNDIDACAPTTADLLFYQVVGVCGPNEGPN